MTSKSIALVVYPDFMSLDLFGPLEVFNAASRIQTLSGKSEPYVVRVVSSAGGLIPTESGVQVATEKLPAPKGIDTALVVGGNGVYDARNDERLLSWVKGHLNQRHRVYPAGRALHTPKYRSRQQNPSGCGLPPGSRPPRASPGAAPQPGPKD